MASRRWKPIAAIAATAGVLLAGSVSLTTAAPGDALPKPAEKASFAEDIKPLINERCARCHTQDKAKGGVSMNTRESLLNSGEDGPVVVPGKSAESRLIEAVTGPEPAMPKKGKALSENEIAALRAWIDQGVKWQEGFSFAERQYPPIAPREPELPSKRATGFENPVDRLLAPYFEKHGVATDEVVSDRLFARRVHLDLVGLLPDPATLAAFVQDERPDKRARLVRQLLERRRDYASHWITFWNDRLRNAYRGTGFIDDGREQITGWLYEALYSNKPYDDFVRELIRPADGARGFLKGIKWRGVVNASQRKEMQAAQVTSQVFLGVNLKCASCHDSFVDDWKLSDAYSLANVFADEPLETHRCNKPMGEFEEPGYLWPGLGEIDPDAPVEKRRAQLAKIITSPENGRLTRTIVNRLWAKLMGRGLIAQVDKMAAEPWHDDLLDWLAVDFRKHGYDLKHTLELICTSRAYQLKAEPLSDPNPENYVFRGPAVKRMTAEQFVDGVAAVTETWEQPTKEMLKRDGRGQGGQLKAIREALRNAGSDGSGAANGGTNGGGGGPPLTAKWIWRSPEAASEAPAETVYFRKTVTVGSDHHHARAVISADNHFTLYVNGRKVASGDQWDQPVAVELADVLKEGTNVIAIEAENTAAGPAGLIFQAVGYAAGEHVWAFGSDGTWRVATDVPGDEWRASGFEAGDWPGASAVAAADGGPWKLSEKLTTGLTPVAGPLSAPHPEEGEGVRAALADADPLMRALGRPNREQVETNRESKATMLQTLELTNGQTLDSMLKRGAEKLLNENEAAGPGELTERIYLRALGRSPNEAERRIARDLIGSTPTKRGVADLLWSVSMLPEFQLIY